MKIEFRNDEYIKSHGKAPKGYGSWAFAASRNPDPLDLKFFHGTLTQAKAQAKEHYKKIAEQNGESWMILYVMP